MQSEFARDLADVDRPIVEAAVERPGKPIRLRVQPMILRAGGQYRGWPTVSWNLECETPDEAFAVRDAMRVFFAALMTASPAAVTAALTAIPTVGKEAVA